MNDYAVQIEELFEAGRYKLSDIKPSEWYERNMVMPQGSAFPGPFRYDKTPYWREVIDCASPEHPCKEATIIGNAQGGKSAAVLWPIVGYTISQNPGNVMFLTGHTDLSKQAMQKIDVMIDACGIRHLIKPNVVRAKNSRTGDTDMVKEFIGGDLKMGSVTNHNLLRQNDVMIMIVDDYDAAPSSSKAAGSTRELVQKRTSAYMHKRKIFWVSSPQLKGKSNIESTFLCSDQRYYNVPCPCCHEMIVLKWSIETGDKETAGITWKMDQHGRVDRKTVGYVCQKCSKFFDDSHKYDMNINGLWVPTVIPKEEDHYGYHMNGLYSPAGMDDWAFYVTKYLEANPIAAPRNQKKHQTFLNVDMGEPYEDEGEEVKSSDIMKNCREYEVGMVPEKLSMQDGNGKIVMLTCAADMNGTVFDSAKGTIDDARLDFEILAHSETGSTYSVMHGSIGTFVPLEKAKKITSDRARWSYQVGKENCVWPVLTEILNRGYKTDTGRTMGIFFTGLDCGHYTNYAYHFVDTWNGRFPVVGLKGDKENKYMKYGIDVSIFSPAKERGKLFMVQVNKIKEDLSYLIKLKWDPRNDISQPVGLMNYPQPSGGLYTYNGYFSHYEAETRTTEETKDGYGLLWKKKNNVAQNHFWDCRVYNIALREIAIYMIFKELKIPRGTWADYVAMSKGQR